MGLWPVLVDLYLALKIEHLQLKANNARQHFVLKIQAQINPLLLEGRLVVADQFLKQTVFGQWLFDQGGLHRAMHR